MNWDQLKTILWLRWRLTQNTWTRNKGLGAVVAVLTTIGAVLFGGMGFVGALLGGIFGLRHASPNVVWGVCFGITLGFLVFWMFGVLQEIQRSETIDLQRLMHLPVVLGQIFIINFAASHAALSIVVFVPALVGLSIGLAISRGPAMLLLLPLALAMVFMITAWTFCLRGWLATLMSNPRRRRSVIMGITFAFILLFQAPNLYFNVFRRISQPAPAAPAEQETGQRPPKKSFDKEQFEQLLSIQKYIPPLWLPLGAQELADGRALPAMLGTLGCLAIGALGLRRAYRGTMRFYLGQSGKTAKEPSKSKQAPVAAAVPGVVAAHLLERRIPAVPEQAAALALATFRSMLRAPEVKMAWGASFLVPLIVGSSLLFRPGLKIPEEVKPFVATAAVTFSVFMLVQFFSNQFGFDREGFRALVLSPVERRLILLGKNLACVPVGVGFGVLLLALVSVLIKISPLTVLAALLQLAALLLLAGLAGNLLSILVPYRIRQGSMKASKLPVETLLAILACQLLFPIAIAPVFVPPLAESLWRHAGWSGVVPVNLILSLALAIVMALGYWQSLSPLGRLLQRRETKILGIVTVEIE